MREHAGVTGFGEDEVVPDVVVPGSEASDGSASDVDVERVTRDLVERYADALERLGR